MLIIAGHLVVAEEQREAYVAGCRPAVEAARLAPGCLDYAVTADAADPRRVCIYERWETEEELLAFRGFGPDDDQQQAILGADVKRYTISSVGDA